MTAASMPAGSRTPQGPSPSTRVVLVETGPAVEVPLADRMGLALRASGLVAAVPSVQPGWWEISPATKVGVARVAGVEITVRPKVGIRRLMFLLGYTRDRNLWRDEDVDLAAHDDLLVAVATAFARQALKATAQGLLQGYRIEERASTVLRGRIRATDQLTRHHGTALPLEIRYAQFDTDTAENRILRAATDLLLRLDGLPATARLHLRRLLRGFADVSPLPRGTPIPAWTRSRLNARYHVALGLAELVLRGCSVEQENGAVRIDGFMIDMAKLFEDFVTDALGAELMLRGGRSVAQDRWHLDTASSVLMKPDLVWYGPGSASPTAVVDAKYKAEKPSGYPNADLYQMLAYCTVRRLRRGHLIYAKGNEPEAVHQVVGADVRIHQHALDLDADPDQMLAQIRLIAELVAADSGTVSA